MTEKSRFEIIAHGLREAENICVRNGVRLTRLRRDILESLLASGGPVKAYDLIELMRDKGERLTPATVYRTLDFLLQYGLAHRINSLNAYVPCTANHEEHAMLMFVCSECRRTEELDDPALYDYMRSRLGELGMSLRDSSIEIQGLCRKCTIPHPAGAQK
ncbi:MAG: transcriptional repressor [Deltaproteobacteria bacterium]|jgi:Fur family zinc uptake transcriptional regulator|nr:transcriptional repressor [Deltaproteobacteria bacterium]